MVFTGNVPVSTLFSKFTKHIFADSWVPFSASCIQAFEKLSAESINMLKVTTVSPLTESSLMVPTDGNHFRSFFLSENHLILFLLMSQIICVLSVLQLLVYT